ncbi:hypothetical protein [Reinekea blandensis]|uniref:Uncharacterized protein n=1 Tax=Reinekea blandensis MED297 TaxID=314283 RepID=A4B8W8_9GAMM|nr:hypothetical protein [Reinekea blandensis]EAR11069.1 hypothetical protein MED297_19317 [Reinekea sp. MED297] [Reinekea blandensis MED297]
MVTRDATETELKNAINQFKRRVYFFFIFNHFGGSSYGRIEKQLTGHHYESSEDFWEHYPRCLYRLNKGQPLTNETFLGELHKKIPETKFLSNHILWHVLTNPLMNETEVIDCMKSLPLKYSNKLFSATGEKWKRKELRYISQINHFAELGDYDALACILLLIREAELNKKAHAYVRLKWAVRDVFSILSTKKGFQFFGNELFELCDALFLKPNNPLPNNFTTIFDRNLRIYQYSKGPFSIDIECSVNTALLYHAEIHGFVSRSSKAQHHWLMAAIENSNRAKLEEELKQLDFDYKYNNNTNSLPDNLKQVMINFTEDKRKDRFRSPLF